MKTVAIDCFPESAQRYRSGYAIVVIDVIRATTTAVTAVQQGRRVFPVRTSDEAFVLAATLEEPLLVGELGGNMPYGFDLTNSPAEISMRTDVHRPIVLVSSSGTQLLLNSVGSDAVYIACLRNLTAVSKYLSERHDRVAVLGAGSRGQFRREDQMGCAWLSERLLSNGFHAENPRTEELVRRWQGESVEVIRDGRSADYLRNTGQERDLDFILGHVDDVEVVTSLVNGELIPMTGMLPRPSFGLS
ncbi:MAG: hypothetical protein A2Y72_02095 [Chloroflexi bacterium RBG_13_53_26]|nr:MAG: hypothetical protein A2Y72_02095 [Chloroflexi bacterium RBG_13_53_26]